MFHLSPPWLECLIMLCAGPPCYVVIRLMCRSRRILLETAAKRTDAAKWLQLNASRLIRGDYIRSCVLAPIWEEAAFRGPSVLLLVVYDNFIAALVVGLVLHVTFIWVHPWARSGEANLREVLFMGLITLAMLPVALITGLIVGAALMHGFINALVLDEGSQEMRRFCSGSARKAWAATYFKRELGRR